MNGQRQHPQFAGRPEGLTPLGRLSQYMNFRRIRDDPPVVVTTDHRAVLVAGWAAREQGFFRGEMPALVRLDAHPDAGERPRPWSSERAALTDLDEVHAIANAQRHDDGGWLIAAFQFQLARQSLNLFVHDVHRFPGDNDPYQDDFGVDHPMATFESIYDFLESTASSHRTKRFAHSIGYELDTGWTDKGPPLWVDIDLDFATHPVSEGQIPPWSDEDWERSFFPTAVDFLAGAFERAALVTIATEPEFCGGLEACGKIARRLKAAIGSRGQWLERL